MKDEDESTEDEVVYTLPPTVNDLSPEEANQLRAENEREANVAKTATIQKFGAPSLYPKLSQEPVGSVVTYGNSGPLQPMFVGNRPRPSGAATSSFTFSGTPPGVKSAFSVDSSEPPQITAQQQQRERELQQQYLEEQQWRAKQEKERLEQIKQEELENAEWEKMQAEGRRQDEIERNRRIQEAQREQQIVADEQKYAKAAASATRTKTENMKPEPTRAKKEPEPTRAKKEQELPSANTRAKNEQEAPAANDNVKTQTDKNHPVSTPAEKKDVVDLKLSSEDEQDEQYEKMPELEGEIFNYESKKKTKKSQANASPSPLRVKLGMRGDRTENQQFLRRVKEDLHPPQRTVVPSKVPKKEVKKQNYGVKRNKWNPLRYIFGSGSEDPKKEPQDKSLPSEAQLKGEIDSKHQSDREKTTEDSQIGQQVLAYTEDETTNPNKLPNDNQDYEEDEGDNEGDDEDGDDYDYVTRVQKWDKMEPEAKVQQIQTTYGDDIMLRTAALHDAVQSLQLDARVLCTLLLDNKIEPNSRALPRKGQLQQIENLWYLTTNPDNEPHITDHVWLLVSTPGTNQSETVSLGFINYLRKIVSPSNMSTTLVFEVKISSLTLTNMNAFSPEIKQKYDVLIEPFSLDISSTCSTISDVPDVIATFVQNDVNGLLFHELISNGTLFPDGRSVPSKYVPVCIPGEYFKRLQSGLKKRMEHRLPSAELQRIWAAQQQRKNNRAEELRQQRRSEKQNLYNNYDEDNFELDNWKLSDADMSELQYNQEVNETYQGVVASTVRGGGIGGIVGYDAYLRSVSDFRETFAALLSNSVKDPSTTTDSFITQFIVPLNIYEDARKTSLQNWALLSSSLGSCKTSFLMNIQEQLFRALLFELNSLAQVTDASSSPASTLPLSLSQICALSWLLFYSQLPVFVAKLSTLAVERLHDLQMTKSVGEVMKIICVSFMENIFVKMLPSMLPTNASNFQQFEIDVVFHIRKYIDPVSRAVLDNVDSFLSHSSSNC